MTGIFWRAKARRHRCAMGLATALACAVATVARADVRVEGGPAALRVMTDQAAISDVLAAFAGKFKVSYRTAIPLDAAADAAYAGSVGQVISRLLEGYNYVVKKDGEATEITIFGRRGEVAIPPPAPKVAPPAGISSRWR
ncbi:MAG TPA: hypothetical protein VH249_24250 [Xanthobacteraceae bacterium]|nr:hypothetical protein [Xanthobacteraceae bacterium]